MRHLTFMLISMFQTIDSCHLSTDDRTIHTPAMLHSFSKVYSPVSLWEFQENINVTRFEAINPIHCARLTSGQGECCKPFGFLYDSTSRTCQPIPWRDDIEVDLQNLSLGNSSIYQFLDHPCREGYKAYQYKKDDITITVCLQINYNKKFYYYSADRDCTMRGGYIAPAKTQEKLSLLLELSKVMDTQEFWVGLDDIEKQRQLVWKEDKAVLTPEQELQLFKPGEPNFENGDNCAAIMAPDTKLVDQICFQRIQNFCEVKPGC